LGIALQSPHAIAHMLGNQLAWKNGKRSVMKSCKDIAELASRSLDVPLSFRDRLALRLHLMFCACPICRKFFGQLNLSRTACQALAQRLQEDQAYPDGMTLSNEARDRILRVIKSKQ